MNPPEFARHWARELGSNEESLVKLQGGINNHVYLCGTHGCQWVIKGYPNQLHYDRDRMQAEVEFLRYALQVVPERVPELISVDADRRCVVLEHIQGDTYPEGITPPIEDVQVALEFFQQLNADLSLAREMICLDAGEAFLNLRLHMNNVHERLDAMGTDHLPAKFKNQAAKLIAKLQSEADRVEARLEIQISSGEVEDTLDLELLRVSPSDFGFHNAIKTSAGVKFIDFEFAGWDDPAKTACDFSMQPSRPIAIPAETLSRKLMQTDIEHINSRTIALSPILKIKWACIALSVLNSDRCTKIENILPNKSIESIIASRFEVAKSIQNIIQN